MMVRNRLLFFALLAFLASAAVAQPTCVPVAPGLAYGTMRLEQGPWEVRYLVIDRQPQYLRLDMALGMGKLRGVEKLTGTVARETKPDDYVVAAVNADFFTMSGNPNAGLVSGLTVRRGELIMTARNRPGFVMLADGTPRIGAYNTTGTVALPAGEVPLAGLNQPPVKDGLTACTAIFGWPVSTGCVAVKPQGLPLRVNGAWQGTVAEIVPVGTEREAAADEVLLHADGAAAGTLAGLKAGDAVEIRLQTPDLPAPVAMAAGGNLILMKDGQLQVSYNEKDPRHPRTAIGFNGRQIIMATVDGRQAGWSVGMTYHELALLMQSLGCTDALNLDGGGSTTAWVRGEVVNRPSGGILRQNANAILVRSTAPHGSLARLMVGPRRLVAMSGACLPVSLRGFDDSHNPADINLADLVVSAKRGTAALGSDGLVVTGRPGRAIVQFGLRSTGQVLAEVPVRLVRRCTGLTVSPARVTVLPNKAAQLTASGVSIAGEPVALPAACVEWRVEGKGLAITPAGLLSAEAEGATGTVRAVLGALTGEAAVGTQP